MSGIDLKRAIDELGDAAWCEGKNFEDWVEPRVNAIAQALDERDALKAEMEMQKRRGDNHWETLRSIRDIAKTSGDIQRIIQWVNDAGAGYTESVEETMASLMDKTGVLIAERDALKAELEAARKQRPCGYMDEEAGVTVVYNAACAGDFLRHTPVYKRPVPAQQLPDDARYPFDPIYDKGEYYITGAAINEILIPFVNPQTAQQLALEEVGAIEVRGKHVAASYSFTGELPQGTHTLYIKKQ